MRVITGRRLVGLAWVTPLIVVSGVGLGTSPSRGQENENPGFMASAGRETYQTYCASCHGTEADGRGSLARHLTVRPTDLTKVKQLNQGVFPKEEVRQAIDGRKEIGPHGSADMPVWGDVFQSSMALKTFEQGETDEDRAARKIRELVQYLESIQVID